MIAQVLFGGVVIDTLGWFRYSGELSRSYTYGDSDRGKTVVFRARVLAHGAKRDLKYEVKVL